MQSRTQRLCPGQRRLHAGANPAIFQQSRWILLICIKNAGLICAVFHIVEFFVQNVDNFFRTTSKKAVLFLMLWWRRKSKPHILRPLLL